MHAFRFIVALALTAASGAAMAHGGHGGNGFMAGFAHPFSGLDHMLAMVAVGLLASRQKGIARFALPAGFVLSMIGGALAGAAGWVLPTQEAAIATSLLVFGLMIAFVVRAPLPLAMAVVSLFAVFHGGAHFVEMGHADLITYVIGFALATVALHGAGLLLANWAPEHRATRQLKRALGGLIAGTGLVLLGS